LKGIVISSGTSITLSHVQLLNCGTGVEAFGSYTVNLRNALMHNLGHALAINSSSIVKGEHVTVHNTTFFKPASSSLPSLTNCLLIAAGNYVAFNGSNVETNLSDTGIFQTVGAGSHYLAASSPYRDVGTTNINPALLEDIGKLTTYPPVVLTNDITANTILWPQAQRDTNAKDLGYLYDPIDFALNGISLTNATLFLTNGVAISVYGEEGLWLRDNSSLVSVGSASVPNVLTRYNCVQELPIAWGTTGLVEFLVLPRTTAGSPPAVDLTFTRSYLPADSGYHTYTVGNAGIEFDTLSIRHCEFSGGQLNLVGTNGAVYGLTNSLFERVTLNFEGDATLSVFNSTIRGGNGGWVWQDPTNSVWTFKDNLLDSSEMWNLTETLIHENNAYFNSDFDTFYTNNLSEVVLTNLAYLAGPLGRYYHSTNSPLLNAGSRDADDAGLFHFTITVDQAKETNSVVDIGHHYVAVDPETLLPLDFDEDGLPDYIEDANGNGSVDQGETDWTDPDTDGDGVNDYLEWLQGRDPLTAGATTEPIELHVFTPLQ
jgi:hypothetical protein